MKVKRDCALYTWEGDGEYWHGPIELPADSGRRAGTLEESRATCTIRTKCRPCNVPIVLTTTVRDVGDCALATIDSDTGELGPLAILTIIPANRRRTVRSDFAFELTAFVRFLEHLGSAGSELTMHNHIEEVLEAEKHRSVVFAFCSRACCGDMSIAVSQHIEKIAASVLDWKLARDCFAAPSDDYGMRPSRGSLKLAGGRGR